MFAHRLIIMFPILSKLFDEYFQTKTLSFISEICVRMAEWVERQALVAEGRDSHLSGFRIPIDSGMNE